MMNVADIITQVERIDETPGRVIREVVSRNIRPARRALLSGKRLCALNGRVWVVPDNEQESPLKFS